MNKRLAPMQTICRRCGHHHSFSEGRAKPKWRIPGTKLHSKKLKNPTQYEWSCGFTENFIRPKNPDDDWTPLGRCGCRAPSHNLEKMFS